MLSSFLFFAARVQMDTRTLDPTRLSSRLLIGFAGRERDLDEDKQAAGRPDVEASGALS